MWPLVAFGGAYAWTLPPLYLLVAAAIFVVRPSVARGAGVPLDIALAAALAAAAAQLIPLGASLRDALSPNAAAFDAALRFDQAGGLRPLSIDPRATATWLPAGAAAVALFWVARDAFDTHVVRHVARAIAWTGLVVAPLVIVLRYSAPFLIYAMFQPVDVGSKTAGPFVNRNHMATWLLLALPTTVGYVVAHSAAYADGRAGVAGAVKTLEEPRTVWLLAAAVVMLAALITTESRSGLIGLAAALSTGMVVPRAGGRRAHRGAAALIIVAGITVAVALASTGALIARFEDVGTDPAGGRIAIWHATMQMIRDFPVTGVGVGSYSTAMLTYQQQGRYGFFYNQAHDQYLQFAAEGGLLLVIPLVCAIAAFVAVAKRALASDRSPLFWLRAGALSALVAVGVQSIWETGLRMPANAVLFAVVTAIVIYPRTHAEHSASIPH